MVRGIKDPRFERFDVGSSRASLGAVNLVTRDQDGELMWPLLGSPRNGDYQDVASQKERFTRLMTEHGSALRRLVATYVPPADQDDLAQEVALAVWNALETFRGDCSERTFVFRIAHNRGLTYLARRRVRGAELTEMPDGARNPEAQASDREEVGPLFAAIRMLSVPLRQVLTLSLENMTHAEIATCLGITPENVAVRLGRARAALRARMEES
jgi:RNA polymerase sigma-70 factor (ECF subfamily)